jgi:hypothetical protein
MQRPTPRKRILSDFAFAALAIAAAILSVVLVIATMNLGGLIALQEICEIFN